ncbi:MAG: adenosylcobinamide-GDP ribazoletransferase [Coriobacteriia bacterium]
MTREHPLRDAGLAISLLTAIPTRAKWPEDGGTQSAAWFPVVGWLVGGVGYAIVKLAEALDITPEAPMLIAALVVTAWALLTRLLHWDGLADVADGFWGSHDPARRLEIMSDSATGAFGTVAVVLVALLEVSAIGAIVGAPHQVPVLLVPVFARFSATAAAWFGKPARREGLGVSVMREPTPLSLMVTGAALLAAIALWGVAFHPRGVAFGLVGLVIALVVPYVLAKRFGGVTGDVMGASILLTETLLFTTFILGANP